MRNGERCGWEEVKIGHYRGFDLYLFYQTELDGSVFEDSVGTVYFKGYNQTNWQIGVNETRSGYSLDKLKDEIDYTLDRQFTHKKIA